MINNEKTISMTLTTEETKVVRKEVADSLYFFDLTIIKNGQNFDVTISGAEEELATLSLPTAGSALVVEDEDDESETSLTLGDVKDIAVGGAVGATKIALKTAGGVVEVVGAAGGRAALAGSNTLVRTGKAVAERITEDSEWNEAKANVSAAYDASKTVASKAWGWLGKAGRAIKTAAK